MADTTTQTGVLANISQWSLRTLLVFIFIMLTYAVGYLYKDNVATYNKLIEVSKEVGTYKGQVDVYKEKCR